MNAETRLEKSLHSMGWIRLGAAVFALAQVATYYVPYPPGYETAAYCAVGIFTALSLALMSTRFSLHSRALAGLILDSVFAMTLVTIFTFDVSTAIFIVLYLLPLEGALMFGPRAAIVTALSTAIAYTAREIWGSIQWDGYRGQEYPFLIVSVTFRMGIDVMIALVAAAMARSFQREQQAATRLSESQHQRTEALQRLTELRENFVTNVSHELRTPLTSVIGFADTLHRQLVNLDPRHQEMLNHLCEQATELGDLVEQLTAMAGIDPDSLNVHEHDLVQMVEQLVALKGERVTIDYMPDEVIVSVDDKRVSQAVLYVVDNALRYSENAVHVSVTERKNKGRDGAIIRITDSGPGVPDRLKKRIFSAFERAHLPNDPSPGTGAGLTAARSIVLSHGGSMWVEDAPGGPGAQFCVWLPTLSVR